MPGLVRMSETPPIPEAVPYPIGIGGLRNHVLLRKGDFTVLTGIPGHGKTTLVTDIACRMATEHNWTVTFASFEQNPRDDHRRALRTWYHSLAPAAQTDDQLVQADLWIDRAFGFIVPDEDVDSDLLWLLEMAAASVRRFGTDMLVIDPWNEIEHAKPRDQSMSEYVSWAIRQLKKFARKFDIHVLVVAHPTKLHGQADGGLPMPTLYDISDSAAWANKPDIGIIVHQDGPVTKVKVAKIRYKDRIGKTGVVQLMFDAETNHFYADPGAPQ
jgi:twinkle protein